MPPIHRPRNGGAAFRSIEIDERQLVPMAVAVFGGLDIRLTER